MNRLVAVVALFVLCGCAGRSTPSHDPPEHVEWPDEFDDSYFMAFTGNVADTVAAHTDLPDPYECEGKFYVTGEGEDVVLWLATNGAWVQIAPPREAD